MVFDYKQPIPVTTVDNDNYPKPAIDNEGRWVVSASAVGQDANRVVLFDPLSLTIKPVTTYTSSLDYMGQVRNYENTLDQIARQNYNTGKGLLDKTNPNQVNSFADVINAGSEDFGLFTTPKNFFGDVVPKVFEGDLEGAFDSWWKHSDINMLVDKIRAAKDLIKGGMVDPITAEIELHRANENRTLKDSLGLIGIKYGMNLLTNLGETMDYATGASFVKGGIKGAVDDGIAGAVQGAFNPYLGDVYGEKGRSNVEWNFTPTDSPLINVAVNMTLEVLSDPTTWLTFGTSSAIKSIGKPAISDLFVKSVDDIGVEGVQLSRAYADDLANLVVRTYAKKNNSLSQDVVTAYTKMFADEVIPLAYQPAFLQNLQRNAKVMKEAKDLIMLRSLRAGSDQIQRAAFQIAGATSAAGIGVQAIKGVFHSGRQGIQFVRNSMPYVVSSWNKFFRRIETVDASQLKNLRFVETEILDSMETLKDVVQAGKIAPQEVAARFSYNLQMSKFKKLDAILSGNVRAHSKIEQLHEFAKANGYGNIQELLKDLSENEGVINAMTKSAARQYILSIESLIRENNTDYIHAVVDLINPTTYFRDTMRNQVVSDKLNEDLIQLSDSLREFGNPAIADRVSQLAQTLTQHRPAMVDGFYLPRVSKYNNVADKILLYDKLSYPDSVLKPKEISDTLRLLQNVLPILEYYGVDVKAYHRLFDFTLKNGLNLTRTGPSSVVVLLNTWNKLKSDLVMVESGILGRLAEYDSVGTVTNDILNTMRDLATDIRNYTDVLYPTVKTPGNVQSIFGDGLTKRQVNDIQGTLARALSEAKSKGMIGDLTIVRDLSNTQASYRDLLDPKIHTKFYKEVRDFSRKLDSLLVTYSADTGISYLVNNMLEDNMPYFVQSELSLASGEQLLNRLNYILDKIKYKDAGSTDVRQVREGFSSVDLANFTDITDDLRDLLNKMRSLMDNPEAVTTKQLTSALYTLQLSHFQSLSMLLTTPEVPELLDAIHLQYGAGELLAALSPDDALYEAKTHLSSLASSTYVGNQFLSAIKNSEVHDKLKEGLYNALANLIRRKYHTIPDVATFTDELLTDASQYINRSNNLHPKRSLDLSKTRNITEITSTLHSILYGKSETSEDSFWEPITAQFKKYTDANEKFDVIYSATSTELDGGELFEFSITLPTGETHWYYNREVGDRYVQSIDYDRAKKIYNTSVTSARQLVTENIQRNLALPTSHVYDNTLDFAKGIYEVIDSVKQAAHELDIYPRLIGYGNSSTESDIDGVLSDFLYKNRLNARIQPDALEIHSISDIESLDVMNWVREIHDGSYAVRSHDRAELLKIVESVKNYLDMANAGNSHTTYIMPNFTTETTESLRQIVSGISALLDVLSNTDASSGVARLVRDYFTEETEALLLARYNNDEHSFTALLQTYNSALKQLGLVMNSIAVSNDALSATLFVQKAFQEHLGMPNIMTAIEKLFTTGTGLSPIAFNRFYVPGTVETWFKYGTDFTSKHAVASYEKFGRSYDVAEYLQKELKKIKHSYLLQDADWFKVFRYLQTVFTNLTAKKHSLWNEALINLEPINSKEHNYVASLELFRSIIKITPDAKLDDVQERLKAWLDREHSSVFQVLNDPYGTVMYNRSLYTPNIPVLHSPQLREANELFKIENEFSAIEKAVTVIEDLESALNVEQIMLEQMQLNTPKALAKQELLTSAKHFFVGIQDIFNILKNKYEGVFNSLTVSKLDKHAARLEYTRLLKVINETLSNVFETHLDRRVVSVLTKTPEEYLNYLYSDSQGMQWIDLNSSFFNSEEGLTAHAGHLKQFIKTLIELESDGVRFTSYVDNVEQSVDTIMETTDRKASRYLYIYIDPEFADLKALEETRRSKAHVDSTLSGYGKIPFDFKEMQIALDDKTGALTELVERMLNSYTEFYSTMNTLTHNSYGQSTLRRMHKDRFEELLSSTPEPIKKHMLSLDYLEMHDLFNTFSNNIIGDQYSERALFTYASPNLITNSIAGFNAVYNYMDTLGAYQHLFINEYTSLRHWKSLADKRQLNFTVDSVQQILKKLDMVTVTAREDGTLVETMIKSQADLDAAVGAHSTVAVLSYHLYRKLQEVLNGRHNMIHSNVVKLLNKHYLLPIKIGYLLSTGWVLRNFPDSTIKGFAQAGADSRFITTMADTKRSIEKYWYTYSEIFKHSDAVMSPENIDAYYASLSESSKLILSKPLFKKMYLHYSTSSSTASAAQLKAFSNLAHNLYLKVANVPNMSEDLVLQYIELYYEDPTPSVLKAKLKARFPEDTTVQEALDDLTKFIPKQKAEGSSWVFKVVDNFWPFKAMFDASTKFEEFIRMHVHLYHSEYTLGSSSQARKMVDKSQFNRAYDDVNQKLLEILMPFSSFQMDNMLFWLEQGSKQYNNIFSLISNVLQGGFNEEEFDREEYARNRSLQYLFTTGNIVLDSETGLNLKFGSSLHGTLNFAADPIGTVAEMFGVQFDVAREVIEAINANRNIDEYVRYVEENGKEPYGVQKPFGKYTTKEHLDLYMQLIPIVNSMYTRAWSVVDRGVPDKAGLWMATLFPSIFGVTKLDSAGTTYEGRPIGTDWYNRDAAYKKEHRYVFGVSYVPSWMSKDPETYANTYQRLIAMGHTDVGASIMMQNGWYMKAPDYMLKKYTPNNYIRASYPKRTYHKRSYAEQSYPKYNRTQSKQKKFVRLKSRNKVEMFESDRMRVDRLRPRRVYRRKIYSNLYTRTGVSRQSMMSWRGANRSSRQLLRDRTTSSRIRTRLQMAQMRPS